MKAATMRQPRPGDETILAALSILEGRLREPGACLLTPGQVRAYLMLHLAELEHESFMGLFLDAQNQLIEARELFRGSLSQASVYPREVVKTALGLNAGSVIFAHNHPSGAAEPSHADEMLTRTLKQALALVDVRVVDHFIVAGRVPPLSFAERGLLQGPVMSASIQTIPRRRGRPPKKGVTSNPRQSDLPITGAPRLCVGCVCEMRSSRFPENVGAQVEIVRFYQDGNVEVRAIDRPLMTFNRETGESEESWLGSVCPDQLCRSDQR